MKISSRTAPRAALTVALLIAAASASVPAGAAGQPGKLEGTWRLVEQHYGKGEANMVSAESPVRLEFTRQDGTLSSKIWAGDDRQNAQAWPAWGPDAGPLPVDVLERKFTSAGSPPAGSSATQPAEPVGAAVRVKYRVGPSTNDDLVLVIVEEYRVEPGSDVLEGTMNVRFTGGDTNRGGYVLHRRFERER